MLVTGGELERVSLGDTLVLRNGRTSVLAGTSESMKPNFNSQRETKTQLPGPWLLDGRARD